MQRGQHATMADSSQSLVLGVVLAACSPASAVDDTDACDESACLSSSEGGEPQTSDVLPGDASESSGEGGQGETTGNASSTGLPCDVLDVLRRECHECHGSPPSFGAPMPLMDYDDLQLPAFGDPTRAVYEVVAERLVDEAAMMPPGGEIATHDRDVLLDWIAAGAPEDPTSQCGDAPPDDGPEVGPDALLPVPDDVALDEVHDVLGDVGRVIPDALEVLRDRDQLHRLVDARRVGVHRLDV